MRNTSKRGPAFTGSGIVLVDKPVDWTSFDVVNCVRARFNIPKVGHCGTLDPAATGLLVLLLGSFTKFAAKFSSDNKVYVSTLLLGTSTDSQDITGKVTSTGDWSGLTEEQVRAALLSKLGKSMQLPPMVSAVKKDGRKLYELARKGLEVEREEREIEIFSMSIDRVALPEVDFTVECSKGTYIRTLCSDVGDFLGCGGTLKALRRTACGMFSVEDALTMDELKTMEQPDLQDYMLKFLLKLKGVQNGQL